MVEFLALRKGFITSASLYVVPLVFGIILTVGIVAQNPSIVRTWILVTIIETVVVLAINLGGSIYYSASLDTYYGAIVIAVQVIVAGKYNNYYISLLSLSRQLFVIVLEFCFLDTIYVHY